MTNKYFKEAAKKNFYAKHILYRTTEDPPDAKILSPEHPGKPVIVKDIALRMDQILRNINREN